MKKKTGLVSIGVFSVGMYLIVISGFSWWVKLLFIIFMLVFGDAIIGTIGAGVLATNITYLVMNYRGLNVRNFYAYRWLAVLLLSLGIILIFIYNLNGKRDEELTKIYYKKNKIWVLIVSCYAMLIIVEQIINIIIKELLKSFCGSSVVKKLWWILSWKPGLVGICGICFWIIWIAREWCIVFIEKSARKIEACL